MRCDSRGTINTIWEFIRGFICAKFVRVGSARRRGSEWWSVVSKRDCWVMAKCRSLAAPPHRAKGGRVGGPGALGMTILNFTNFIYDDSDSIGARSRCSGAAVVD